MVAYRKHLSSSLSPITAEKITMATGCSFEKLFFFAISLERIEIFQPILGAYTYGNARITFNVENRFPKIQNGKWRTVIIIEIFKSQNLGRGLR